MGTLLTRFRFLSGTVQNMVGRGESIMAGGGGGMGVWRILWERGGGIGGIQRETVSGPLSYSNRGRESCRGTTQPRRLS